MADPQVEAHYATETVKVLQNALRINDYPQKTRKTQNN